MDITPWLEWAIKAAIGFILYKLWSWVEDMKKKQNKMDIDLALLQKDHESKSDTLARSMHELAEALKEHTREHKEFREKIYDKIEKLAAK